MSISKAEIPFLDTLLTIQGGHIATDLFNKATDCNQLLPFCSFHSPGVFKSIPQRQLTHDSRRVCES